MHACAQLASVTPAGVPQGVSCWEATLAKALPKGDVATLESLAVLADAQQAYPAEIKQGEQQLMLYLDNLYTVSPYSVSAQTTEVRRGLPPSSSCNQRRQGGLLPGLALQPPQCSFVCPGAAAHLQRQVVHGRAQARVQVGQQGHVWQVRPHQALHAGAAQGALREQQALQEGERAPDGWSHCVGAQGQCAERRPGGVPLGERTHCSQALSLAREIEVSHWGNIYVEEQYELVSGAARRGVGGACGKGWGGARRLEQQQEEEQELVVRRVHPLACAEELWLQARRRLLAPPLRALFRRQGQRLPGAGAALRHVFGGGSASIGLPLWPLGGGGGGGTGREHTVPSGCAH